MAFLLQEANVLSIILFLLHVSEFGLSLRASMKPLFARKWQSSVPYHLSNKLPLAEPPVLGWREVATDS